MPVSLPGLLRGFVCVGAQLLHSARKFVTLHYPSVPASRLARGKHLGLSQILPEHMQSPVCTVTIWSFSKLPVFKFFG